MRLDRCSKLSDAQSVPRAALLACSVACSRVVGVSGSLRHGCSVCWSTGVCGVPPGAGLLLVASLGVVSSLYIDPGTERPSGRLRPSCVNDRPRGCALQALRQHLALCGA